MSRRLLPVWCAAVAAVLGVGGCSGASSAQFATPSTMPTAAAVQPTGTPTAFLETEAGARSFVQAVIGSYNYAYATGDTSRLRAMSEPACSCFVALADIEATYKKGQSYRGVSVTVHDIAILRLEKDQAIVVFRGSSTAGELVDDRGQVLAQVDSAPDEASNMRLVWTDHSHWLVASVTPA